MTEALIIARETWLANGLPLSFLDHLKLQGDADSALNSSFKIGALAQASIGLAALAAAYLHYLQTGIEQDVAVNARHAALEFHSECYYTLDEELPPGIWDAIAGLYATKDSSFVRIHTNFPHHKRGVLDILGLPDRPDITRDQVAAAILQWNAEEFEQEAASRGMCVAAYRSFKAWDQHPQAVALQNTPPVTITKIGEAPNREATGQHRYPLEGMRTLDLSRVLAGPVAGRALAAYGADVLLISSPKLPALPGLDADTSRGKRTTQLDLTNDDDHATLNNLVGGADVFLQAYRPGGLAAKGFGPSELVKLRPGIVCANLCAWGWEGPWKDRRGFDSLVQTATGFNHAEAEAYHAYSRPQAPLPRPLPPRPFPVQALDHGAAYLLAFGVIAALCKTITEGGSWEVRVSLAGVGQWLRSFGRIVPEKTAFGEGRALPPRVAPLHPEAEAFAEEVVVNAVCGKNTMKALRHAGVLSATPALVGEAPVVLNAHSAKWN